MNINIQYVKMPFSETMTQYVINKLGQLGEKYQDITFAKVFFKGGNDASGNRKICEINLSAPGPKIFASSQGLDFALAAKETIREIEKQLKKRKAFFLSH